MKRTMLLLLMSLAIAGCFGLGDVPEPVFFYYQAQGLCQGIQVTATVGGFFEGGAVQSIDGTTINTVGFAHNNSITLPKGLSNTGYYRIAVSRPGGSNIYPTAIQLQCLPSSPVLQATMQAKPAEGLRIIEDPPPPSKLRPERVPPPGSN